MITQIITIVILAGYGCYRGWELELGRLADLLAVALAAVCAVNIILKISRRLK